MADLCWSRGPRIGDGVPLCKRRLGHDGLHRPDPSDGWGAVTWGDPLMRQVPAHLDAAPKEDDRG